MNESDWDHDVRTFRESKHIGAWDLRGRDVTVTIDTVKRGEVVSEGGKKDKLPIVSFVGKKKTLALNATNQKTIVSMYGTTDVRKWSGRQITLYGDKCKGARGGIVDCVRIRPIIPKGKDDALPDVPVDQDMRRQQIEQAEGGAREPGED